ncbi:MAG: ankyrin repeat domain-containing protein [Alphaproteobacteria bacterium]|nr:ankyrin repeat domain-containing protein [Alphaproteobacteria bacterium]
MENLNFSQKLIECLKSGTDEALSEANWILNNMQVDINAHDEHGRNGTALMQTAYFGLPEWTDKLLAKGARVDEKDEYGRTALWYASLNGHTDVAVKLIRAGADINVKDVEGYSPIILSTQFKTIDMCCLCLGQGANINDQDVKQRVTPLIIAAASHPTYEKISFLLAAGADVTMTNVYGETALDIAKSRKADAKVIDLLRSYIAKRKEKEFDPVAIIQAMDNCKHIAGPHSVHTKE